jgi:hypothetical protein
MACEFDLVLIAAIDSDYSEALAQQLEIKGVPRVKISILTPDLEQLDKRLREIGFDTESFSYSAQS